MHKFVPLLLLLLVGCGSNTELPIPPTGDDFADNRAGVGTARVFGIDFRVSVQGHGVSSDATFHANLVETEKSQASKSLTMGEDVSIELESINESEVRFVFNDQDYGTLHVGDEVVIDEQRTIEVNGKTRIPTAGEQDH